MQRTELHGSSRTPRVIPAVQALTVLAAAAALAAVMGGTPTQISGTRFSAKALAMASTRSR